MPDLSTTLAGIPLSTCLFNASGPRSGSAEALAKVAASSGAGAVLSKSSTLSAQTGNPQPRTWHGDVASLNSEGLPNKGIDYYIDPETVREASGDYSKPYLVSLSGKTLADNLTMLQKIVDSPASKIAAIELNLACPNVIGKPIIAYDLDQLKDILQQVSQFVQKHPTLPPLGIKLPPYLDFVVLGQVAQLLNQHASTIRFVTAINTLGNAMAVQGKCPTVKSNHGYAGLSGPAVHYTALANVRKLRELLDERLEIVAVGGVQSGADALAFLLCGAQAVQVGTTHWKEGAGCFERIAEELQQVLRANGYESVEAARGQLQEWSRDGMGKSERTTTTSKASSSSRELQFYQFLSALLAILLAVAVAHVPLLPSE